MAYSVELQFDAQSNEKVAALRKRLLDSSVTGLDFGYNFNPHITLGYYSDKISDTVNSNLEMLASTISEFSVTCPGIGFFPQNGKFIAFLVLNNTETLTVAQRSIFNTFDQSHLVAAEYYQPSEWIPHLSFGAQISDDSIKLVLKAYQDVCEQYGNFQLNCNQLVLAVDGINVSSHRLSLPLGTNRNIGLTP